MSFLKKLFKEIIQRPLSQVTGQRHRHSSPKAPSPKTVVAVQAPQRSEKEPSRTQSQAKKRRIQAQGKRGLTVARRSGTGLNI